jgi:hypothetical protein
VRVWAVEGAGHYGAGLARHLSGQGETVIESGRGRATSDGCAVRTICSTLFALFAPRWRARRWSFPGWVSEAMRCGKVDGIN